MRAETTGILAAQASMRLGYRLRKSISLFPPVRKRGPTEQDGALVPGSSLNVGLLHHLAALSAQAVRLVRSSDAGRVEPISVAVGMGDLGGWREANMRSGTRSFRKPWRQACPRARQTAVSGPDGLHPHMPGHVRLEEVREAWSAWETQIQAGDWTNPDLATGQASD